MSAQQHIYKGYPVGYFLFWANANVKGDPATAIFTFEKAVGRKRNLHRDLLECCYMLGLIYSEENNRTKARPGFSKVDTRNINYKDVAERLKAIQ